MKYFNSMDLSSSTSHNQGPQFEIKFKFSRIYFFAIWVSTENNSWMTECLRTVTSPPQDDIVLNREDFSDPDRARQLIGEKLSRWDYSHGSWRQNCIETALEKGWEETSIDRCLEKKSITLFTSNYFLLFQTLFIMDYFIEKYLQAFLRNNELFIYFFLIVTCTK